MEKAKAGVAWIRDNRPWLEQQARQIGQQAYKILMGFHRQVWAKFNQGWALAILTVQHRQEGVAFREALEQAKAEISSMSEAEIAYMVTEFFRYNTVDMHDAHDAYKKLQEYLGQEQCTGSAGNLGNWGKKCSHSAPEQKRG